MGQPQERPRPPCPSCSLTFCPRSGFLAVLPTQLDTGFRQSPATWRDADFSHVGSVTSALSWLFKNAYLFTLLVYLAAPVFVAACGILAPRSGIKPGSPALGAHSVSPWASRGDVMSGGEPGRSGVWRAGKRHGASGDRCFSLLVAHDKAKLPCQRTV